MFQNIQQKPTLPIYISKTSALGVTTGQLPDGNMRFKITTPGVTTGRTPHLARPDRSINNACSSSRETKFFPYAYKSYISATACPLLHFKNHWAWGDDR